MNNHLNYEEVRNRIALEQSMTRQAELILAMLGANLPALIRPHVLLKEDAKTASTDTTRYIYMPQDFIGISTMKPKNAWTRTALLSHELGHWLQPCDEIKEVEKKTGLNHDFVNVVMDVQDEALIASLLPYYNEHLTRLREHTGKKYKKAYIEQAFKSAKAGTKGFLGAAMSLALIGRYVLSPEASFLEGKRAEPTVEYDRLWAYKPRSTVGKRMAQLLRIVASAAWMSSTLLPDLFRRIASEFPELCDKNASSPFKVPESGHGGMPGGAGEDGIGKDLIEKFGHFQPEPPPIHFWEGDALGSRPPTQNERKRANAMNLHFSTPKGGLEIAAPGRFDRLEALRGSPMPWRMSIPDSAGKAKMSDVLIAVDISYSMNGHKWDMAISAARSITLAVRTAGGDVRGLVFDDQVWYAKEFDSKMFFATSVAGISLLEAHENTSFAWLPFLWSKFPNHRVVMITDGGESSSLAGISYVPTRQRARTSAIVIPEGKPENMKIVAANVIEVSSLSLLAGAMTSVLPRRTM